MPNLIDKYRAAHRRIRRLLDPYTSKLCPECPEPCCRKPTKVREFDVLLANSCGCSLAPPGDIIESGFEVLSGRKPDEEFEPCDYLGSDGCVFPDDLRPFECTRWICSYLKREIGPGEMREVRALLHRLGVLHRELTDSVMPRR